MKQEEMKIDARGVASDFIGRHTRFCRKKNLTS